MSIETVPANHEQPTPATPETDKLLKIMQSKKPDLNSDDIACFYSGLRMAGSGYAEVMVQYEQGRVEDGALDNFTGIYADKVALHIPDDIRSELNSGVYVDILEEQAKAARGDAEMSVILAPVVSLVTAESMTLPNPEKLHQLEVAGLESELKDRDTTISEQAKEIARLHRQIAGLKERLGEADDDEGDSEKDEDLDYYERVTRAPQAMGGLALHDVSVL